MKSIASFVVAILMAVVAMGCEEAPQPPEFAGLFGEQFTLRWHGKMSDILAIPCSSFTDKTIPVDGVTVSIDYLGSGSADKMSRFAQQQGNCRPATPEEITGIVKLFSFNTTDSLWSVIPRYSVKPECEVDEKVWACTERTLDYFVTVGNKTTVGRRFFSVSPGSLADRLDGWYGYGPGQLPAGKIIFIQQ